MTSGVEAPEQSGDAMGVDLRIGRKTFGILHRLGLTDITVDYVIVDPIRVPRETFAAIWTAWRDGFADVVSAHSSIGRAGVHRSFRGHDRDPPRSVRLWRVARACRLGARAVASAER